MQHYLLTKKRQRVNGPTNTCGASEENSGDRDGENADTTSAGPQPQEGTTRTQGEKLPLGPKDLSQLPDSACQNEAKRGHREGSQSDNRGDFLKLLNMIFRYDEIVKKLSGSGNAKYMHHDIQNELLDIIAGMIRKYISKEVMEAEHFALMVDEIKNVSKQEQLSIVCDDGAAVMSGHISVVQERLRREMSQAVYVHCYAHRLSLVLVDCVYNVQAAAEFFVTIQKLYKFFSTSVVHEKFLKVQKEPESVNQHIELKRLSDTRWACQHAACLAVNRTLPAIVTTL
ncbi:zinc finger MYM-type protein 1-like [Tachypleus tridentatus]|uniref:zinc finger MYM-type protein 1-like n=1 Tax=Tachypleus tridentatus TaxID=6853 RepID=UPI003FD0B129